MTAAHCCEDKKVVEIVVGEHNQNENEYEFIGQYNGLNYYDYTEAQVSLDESDWTMHPGYDHWLSGDEKTYTNDVCIIKHQAGGLLQKGKHACLPQKGIQVTSK